LQFLSPAQHQILVIYAVIVMSSVVASHA